MAVQVDSQRVARSPIQAEIDHDTFKPEFFDILLPAEDRHFWFRARNRIIAAAIGRIDAQQQSGYWALEGGCGSGNTLRVLERCCTKGRIIGADLYGQGFDAARSRSAATLLRADLMQLPLRPVFGIVAMFDVLEHLPDDRAVLSSLHDILLDDGRLVLTVPRDPALWSETDELVCHHRRYSDDDLGEKLYAAGFETEYLTPFMMAMRILVPLSRRTQPALVGREDWRERALANFRNELRVRPIINGVLESALSLEALWIRRQRRLPTGTSLFAIARKRRK